MSPRRRRTAFTLVEILIVVVILGILAAIVVPQFSPASETTRTNTNHSLLRILRGQLELYKTEHGRYPQMTQLWDALIERTDEAGNIVANGEFGPYLERAPVNAFTNSTTVVAPSTGTSDDGWEYNETTGAISAVGFNEATGVYTKP